MLALGCGAEGACSHTVSTLEPQPVAACERVLSPVPELLEATEQAAARWSQATGCDIHVGKGGLPIVTADASEVTLADGTPKRAVYDADKGEVRYRRGGILLHTAKTVVAHELGHFLGLHAHTPDNLMAEVNELGDAIDAAALDGVCAALSCTAFNPEVM